MGRCFNPLDLTGGQVLGTTLSTSKHYAKEAAASCSENLAAPFLKGMLPAMFNGRELDQSFSPRGLSDGVVSGQIKDKCLVIPHVATQQRRKGSIANPISV